MSKTSPMELFRGEDAERDVEDAQEVLNLCKRLFEWWNKGAPSPM